MNIRLAKLNDLQQIVEIYNQAIKAGQKTADTSPVTCENRTKWFNDHTANKYPILVAESKNNISGY